MSSALTVCTASFPRVRYHVSHPFKTKLRLYIVIFTFLGAGKTLGKVCMLHCVVLSFVSSGKTKFHISNAPVYVDCTIGYRMTWICFVPLGWSQAFVEFNTM